MFCSGCGLAITFSDSGLPGIGIVTTCECATETLSKQPSKRTTRDFTGYSLLLTFCGWRSGAAAQISLADSPILPSTGHGVPAFIIAENTRSS